jgi:hypothetical protein
MRIEFIADKVKIAGPRIDSTYTVTFEVGEYEQDQLGELMKIKQPAIFKVEVSNEENK